MSCSRARRFALLLPLLFLLPSVAAADLTTVPNSWANFVRWYPHLYGGIPARDFESTGGCVDPTKGPAAFSGETDISSGGGPGGAPYNVLNCNPAVAGGTCCGPETSAFWTYFNGGSDGDIANDHYAVRMRVNGDPRDSSDECLTPSHWNFLIESDGDGFKEWWVDLWGNENRIRILYENNNSQQVSNDDPVPPATNTLINQFTACAVAPAAPGLVTCGSGTSTRDCFYTHARVCGVTSLATDSTSCTSTTDASGEWYVDIQVPLGALTDSTGTFGPPSTPGNLGFAFPPQAGIFLSTSDSSTDPVQKDYIADCDTDIGPCNFGDTTSVTLSYFRAERRGRGVVFEWSTGSESGNVGFDLLAVDESGARRLTPRPVGSRRPFSLERVDYRVELPWVEAESFVIEDVDLRGVRRRHGPFALETTYGNRRPVERLDWSAVRAEHERLTARRDAQRRAALVRSAARPAKSATAPAPVVDLLVDRDGIYRVTHEQLAGAGFDFTGRRSAALAVTLGGSPVPVRVGGPARFGSGSFVEFLGSAATGVYTRTNVYRLAVDPARAARVLPPPAGAKTAIGAAGPAAYLESLTVDDNLEWSFAAPGGDPWYRDWVVAFAGNPVERSYPLIVDRLVAGAAPASLALELWGMTDWPEGHDHHVRISLNGTQIADRRFDGVLPLALDLPLPDGLLVEGENSVELSIPADSGVEFEVLAVDRFGVRYPRAFVARHGELAFGTGATAFSIDGFGAGVVHGYQRLGDQVAFLGAVPTQPSATGRQATFHAYPSPTRARFAVAHRSVLRTPGLRAALRAPQLRTQAAQYLVIAHPDFVAGLAPLLDARRADGYTVQVADIEAVYGEFAHGRSGPEGIRAYVRHAASELGTEMVLLVGADSYDYLDYTGAGSISFVPTLYTQTGPIVRWAPADALYGDVDGDDVPDVAVGRLPVRTGAELATLVAKTLAYPAAGHAGRAVAAADRAEIGNNFTADSDAALAALPDDWSVARAYVDELGVAGARAMLLGALDAGVAFAQYTGHSDTDQWSFSALLTREDAAALANAGQPAVVAQFGCWNAFHVSPAAATLADRLLTAGDRGAAALLGPSTLAAVDSHRWMSRLLARELFENRQPLGAAIVAVQRELAATRPWMIDVVRSYTLLGDPALRPGG